jgi:iron complex outermembrane receptor protein
MEPSSIRPLLARVFSVLVMLAALACGSARAAEPERLPVNIEAGIAAVRLNEWAAQTGYSVGSDFETTGSLKTHAVSGVYEPIEALKIMIASTGLTYRLVAERVVTVWLPSEAESASQATVPAPRPRRTAVRSARIEEPLRPLEEITVLGTGTLIVGIPPVGSPPLTLTREDLDATGAVTIADVIRTLPQVFGGGPSEDTFSIGSETDTNSGRGAGVNLRGLGAGSTLALVNGHRLAPGGTQGVFIDITNIPFNAVSHIDIMSDAASALYGADAVGGVVNIVMRENVTGSETQISTGGFGGNRVGHLQVGQLFGKQWDGGDSLMAFEFYGRDALRASERAQATSDLRHLGGDDFRSITANPGTIAFAGRTWAIPAGQDGTGLRPVDLIPNAQNRLDRLAVADILPEQERWSAYGNVRHALTDNLNFFADALFTNRTATATAAAVSAALPVGPSHPHFVHPLDLLVPVFVEYSFLDDLGPVTAEAEVQTWNGVAGVNRGLGNTWNLSASAGYALEEQEQRLANTVDFPALIRALADPDPAKVFNPFGDGSHTAPETLAAIRGQQILSTHSRVSSANVAATGPLFALPGGEAKLAVGADVREQSFDTTVQAGSLTAPRITSGRDVHAAFGELYLPLVGERNARAGMHRIDVSLAARFENYSDFGDAVTPRVGVAWSPNRNLSLRSTWSESLRAPSLYDLNEINNVVTLFPLANAAAQSGLSQVLISSGMNADLQEERATNWTFGLELTPTALPNFSLALTYFDVKFRDRITDLRFDQFDYLNDPRLGERVIFDPTPAQLADACSRGTVSGLIGGDCASASVVAIVDLRKLNSSYLRTSGIDVLGKYTLHTNAGQFKFGLLGTYVLDYSEAVLDTLPVVSMEGTQNYPVDLRLRGTTAWQRGRFEASGLVNYADSYRDQRSTPHRRVASWATLDLSASYLFGDEESGTRLSLDVENVFNELPPFLNNSIGLGYDAENADILGRIVSFRLRKNW